MRAYEIIPDYELEEDFKSIKHKAASALAAGSMMATGTIGPASAFSRPALSTADIAQYQATPQHKEDPPKVNKDQMILALTMWAEARNQGLKGMRAVGHVIKNRAEADKPKLFGQGIKGVALKDRQFSFWNDNEPEEITDQVKDLDPATPDGKTWEEAYNLAGKILKGKDHDPTKGATYYHTTAVNPNWSNSMEPTTQIADHIFYKPVQA